MNSKGQRVMAKEEADMPFKGPYKTAGERKDEYGNKIKNVAKHLAKKAMNAKAAMKEDSEQVDEMSSKMKMKLGLYGKKKKMKEEAEELDEISTKLALDYMDKASDARGHKNMSTAKQDKRYKSVALAHKKIAGRGVTVQTKEEVEQVDEISSDMAHRYLKGKRERDYNTSADGTTHTLKKPTTLNRLNRDIKGTVRALRTIEKSKKTNEEVEQVDEISKATMGRYINKAKDSIDMTSYRSGIKDGTAISSSTPYKSNNPLEKKLTKRHKGISMAVKKLTKEDIDAVKKMNESYKTAFETALNEYGIKSPSELDESKRKEFFNHVDLEFKKGDN